LGKKCYESAPGDIIIKKKTGYDKKHNLVSLCSSHKPHSEKNTFWEFFFLGVAFACFSEAEFEI
jgi:hypothetical protein